MTGKILIRTNIVRFAAPLWCWRACLLLVAAAAFSVVSSAQAPSGEIAAVAAPQQFDAMSLARKYAQEYFDKFSSLTCKESLTQFVLNRSGHSIYRENSSYDYQFEATIASGNLKFNETRETRSPAFRDPGRTLLVTKGFASLLLVAHPMYEASYVFEPAGSEIIDGTAYTMIRFVPVPGAASPVSLRLRGRNYPLPMSGTLWVDSRTGAIVKLQASVDSSLSDLGLAGLRSEVRYAPHSFRDPAETIWVAESAEIEVETPRQHWRNLHKFSDYKRFSVNVHEEIGDLP